MGKEHYERECRLIYYSQPTQLNSSKLLDDILKESIRHNSQVGISGLLTYDDRYFMQVLEGGVDVVNDLYARIIQDRRHYKVRLVSYELIEEKRFSEWSMAAAKLPDIPGRFVEDQFGGFNPPRFGSNTAVEFLEILGDYLRHHQAQPDNAQSGRGGESP